MSAVYNLEPQPTAKVLLETTSGEILLELFAKQTPLASRNFIQLCLEDYYNGTIFHRVVPGFVIQGGDPSGTGDGGEAIYDGGVFEDEFHSRLKFNRRGLLGMANSGRKNDNGSQFFLTLGKTEELNNKNTMFGRIVGDTIYNLMKMGEAELAEGEGSERPLYPTRITKTEVLLNPFEDIVPRKKAEVKSSEPAKAQAKKSKKKATKALLSFEDEENEPTVSGPALKRAKFNPKLVVSDPRSTDQPPHSESRSNQPARSRSQISFPAPPVQPELPRPEHQLPIRNEETPSIRSSSSSSPEPEQVSNMSSLLKHTNAQIAELKQSMKRNVSAVSQTATKHKSALEAMIPASASKGRKRKHATTGQNDGDARALDMLNAFKAKLDQAPVLEASPRISRLNKPSVPSENANDRASSEDEGQLCDLHFIANCQSCASWDEHPAQDLRGDSDDDAGWMNHSLVFGKDHLGKDLSWKKKNEEELVVIDPREKAKDIVAEHKAKRAAEIPGHKVRDAGRGRSRTQGA